jgi:LacI family transcriptional regulator
MPHPKRVTTKTLAAELGVSQRTVSEALNSRKNQLGLKKETIERIRAHAEKRGYRPNIAARQMRQRGTRDVGLLVAAEHGGGEATLLDGTLMAILSCLRDRDRRLLMGKMSDDRLREADTMRRLLADWGVSGLLVNYIQHEPDEFKALLHSMRIPAVWVNNRQPEDCVVPDDREATAEMVRRLCRAGARRPAYLHLGFSDHFSAAERATGYREGAAECGFPPFSHESEASETPSEALAALDRNLKALDEPPDAWICYDMYTLRPFEAYLRSIRSDPLRVVFHDHRHFPRPPNLRVAELHGWKMGETACDLLERKLANPSASFPPEVVPIRLPDIPTLG